MIFQIFCFVTFTGALAQQVPLTSNGHQPGSVSYPELIAMLAMRNQLPVGDQQYTLLNLTKGMSPPTPVYPIRPPVPKQPQRPVQIQSPVQQKPMIPQVDIQSAVQSAVNEALSSAIRSAVKTAIPAFQNPEKAATTSSPLDMQSLIQAAVNSAVMSTGAAGTGISSGIAKPTNTGPPPACTGQCPPKWLTMVHGYTGVMKPGNAMCKYKKLLTPCDKPNSPCKPGYSCCPTSCLQTIAQCYDGPPMQSACLPDDVTPWWPEMVQTYMQANGMGQGAMGAGMGGMMGIGGGLAGMMGGFMGGF